MTELLNCPFCGGEAESRLYDSEYFVQCMQCFNSTAADHQDEEAAVAAWNRRAQPAEADGVDRARMIESMCLTWRHDFGLDKPEGCKLSSGMTDAERDGLRRQMGQLFDHHFAPGLSAVTAERDNLLEGRVLDAETISTLEQELKQSRDAYQHMIDQTMPLEPVPGDPRWSKRIELDDVIAERGQLRAEVAVLQEKSRLSQLLPELDDALEDLELHGCHSDLGYRKLKDWYRKTMLATQAIDVAMAAKEGV